MSYEDNINDIEWLDVVPFELGTCHLVKVDGVYIEDYPFDMLVVKSSYLYFLP